MSDCSVVELCAKLLDGIGGVTLENMDILRAVLESNEVISVEVSYLEWALLECLVNNNVV